MRRAWPLALALMLLAAPLAARTQATDEASLKNARQARTVLDAMVRALGGEAWLNQKNQMRQGRVAAYFHGQPSGGDAEYWEYHGWPDHDRIEFSKHRDVVQFFLGRVGSEVTFRGAAPLPQEQVDDFLRRRDHSIETVVKLWLNDPKTLLIYEGQKLAQRRMADQVTLVSAQNDSVTIQIDAETHLPVSRSFVWRDPVYKDDNQDSEEYDDYLTVDGFPTPFIITRFKNDDIVRQLFMVHVSYNQELPPDFWSVDAAERRIKK
jgi:hypothetical protein